MNKYYKKNIVVILLFCFGQLFVNSGTNTGLNVVAMRNTTMSASNDINITLLYDRGNVGHFGDSSDIPASKFTVQLLDLTRKVIATKTTNQQGKLTFTSLNKGEYIVKVVLGEKWIGSPDYGVTSYDEKTGKQVQPLYKSGETRLKSGGVLKGGIKEVGSVGLPKSTYIFSTFLSTNGEVTDKDAEVLSGVEFQLLDEKNNILSKKKLVKSGGCFYGSSNPKEKCAFTYYNDNYFTIPDTRKTYKVKIIKPRGLKMNLKPSFIEGVPQFSEAGIRMIYPVEDAGNPRISWAPGYKFINVGFIKRVATVNYQTFVHKIGWQNSVKNGAVSGTVGKELSIESIRLYLSDLPTSGGIAYSVQLQRYGWQKPVVNNQGAGVAGSNLRIEGLRIVLTGEIAKQYDVYYRTKIQNYGWLGWSKNGGSAGSEGRGLRLEALEVKLVQKGKSAPSFGKAFVLKNGKITP